MVKRIFKLLSIALISISQNYSVFGQTPTRIVSLAPSLTKNVYFLEQQHKLVGCTSYCDTAVANGKEVVASAVKVGETPRVLISSFVTAACTLGVPSSSCATT